MTVLNLPIFAEPDEPLLYGSPPPVPLRLRLDFDCSGDRALCVVGSEWTSRLKQPFLLTSEEAEVMHFAKFVFHVGLLVAGLEVSSGEDRAKDCADGPADPLPASMAQTETAQQRIESESASPGSRFQGMFGPQSPPRS